MQKLVCLFLAITGSALMTNAQVKGEFNGLGTQLGNLYLLSDARTRSIGPENPTGGKGSGGMATLRNGTAAGAARDLGQGWKVNPYIIIKPGQTVTLADISGAGSIEHIWMTITGNWRLSILRMYWDKESTPSVEVPVGDFFCMGWGTFAPLRSLAVCVNPGSGLNCYWPMPFRHSGRITLENLNSQAISLYYEVTYAKTRVPADAGYFHAQFRRSNPNPYKSAYTILDGVRGEGQYVGTYLAWGVRNNGWWGEGEVKFYIDGDKQFPTINGTGTEDYFCGSYDFEDPQTHQYETFTSPYSGLCQVIKPDGLYRTQERFGMYRWHITDPVRFSKDLKVTIQDLGWRHNGTYLPQQSDISSVAYWYQQEPHAPFPPLPSKQALEEN
ncbi:MAG TPA: glycoside hydrolase family 172 protein [Chitinophagaceae bacterium]|nr:glycoside hydrolase family 172 protein [Chitinophagaceae bacterium]